MSPSPSRRPSSKTPPRGAKSKRPATPSTAKPAAKNAAQSESPATITAIEIEGFKCFGKAQRVEIRPLTLLAGANSSGKSSLMQPLLLMKQTLNATFDPGPLLLDGPNVSFTEASQFLSKDVPKNKASRQEMHFRVGVADGDGNRMGWCFELDPHGGMVVAKMTFASGESVVDLQSGMTVARIRKMTDPIRHVRRASAIGGEIREDTPVQVVKQRCMLSLLMEDAYGEQYELPANELFWGRQFSSPFRIGTLVHVPALRGTRERVHQRLAVGPMFPGRFDDYVASLVDSWQNSKHRNLRSLSEQLQSLRLTRSVRTRPVSDVHLEILVGRLPVATTISTKNGRDEPDVNIADVGFGISQVLPVLVALLAAKPGQVVYLEQPEIHLHPRAQTALASVLADAARRGVRVVAETHSSLLLLGVQTLVAEGKLDPQLVKLHWFTRDEHGTTRVTSTDLDDEGAFETDWPEDFGSVELDAQRSFIRAVARHRTGKNGQ